MRWWVAGCALVLLLVAASSASVVSVSGGGSMGPTDRDLPSVITVTVVNARGPASGTGGVITVNTIESAGFVEVPGYIAVLNGPIRPAAPVERGARASAVSVSVYTVKSGDEAVAFAVECRAPEKEAETGGGLAKEDTLLSRGGEVEAPPLSSNSLPVLPGFGGRTRYYMLEIAPDMTCFWVDLVWRDPDRPLDLTIYYPGGVLGTYDDMSDGREDGRIYLRISNDEGIAAGNWFLKISGSKSFTSRNYAFTTYLG